jgi:hypothetical protein
MVMFPARVIPDHTRLSELTSEQLRDFLQIILKHPDGASALAPLTLLDGMPNAAIWRTQLTLVNTEGAWETLRKAVIPMLDHQSEISTDIRWLKMITCMRAGKLQFPSSMKTRVHELVMYPAEGDLRSVRPSIRAGEMMLRRHPVSSLGTVFWSECFEKTECLDPTSMEAYAGSKVKELDIRSILDVRLGIVRTFHEKSKGTAVDAVLEGASGLALYALALLHEIKFSKTDGLVLGRFAIRSLAETYITIKYLVSKNNADIWKTWRVYGNGQTKLAFLQMERHSKDVPAFMDIENMESLANEDQWIEFQNIDIGHWNKTSLRDMATEAGIKDIYEKYYQWTSTYMHSHWCATRDVNFITCHNPLHRLHRIPRLVHRSAPSALYDAVKLTNLVIDTFAELFKIDGKDLPRIQLENPIEP